MGARLTPSRHLRLAASSVVLAAAAFWAAGPTPGAGQEGDPESAGDDCFVHDRDRGECSPGTEAPSPAALAATIRSGIPSAFEAALEYGERVECYECMPLLEGNLLEADDPDVRRMSAWWLRRRGLALGGVVRRMRLALESDPDATHRARAALALGELMAARTVATLEASATTDMAPEVRAAAVQALGRLNHPDGRSALAAALEDDDARVRRAAVDQVLVVSFFDGDDALLGLLDDDDATLRRRGAKLVAERGIDEAVPVLVALLDADPEPSVRQAAAWALGRLGTGEARTALRERADAETDPRVEDAIRIARQMR